MINVSKAPSVIEDPKQFYDQLIKVLLMLNSKYIELEEWFNIHLKPLLVVSNHNYFAGHLALRKLSETNNGNNARLKVVLERVYKMSKLNEDTLFLAEYCRFAQHEPIVQQELIASIMSIVQCDGNPPGGAVLKLHRLYKSDSPPDVALIRSHDVIQHIVTNVCSPGRTAQKEMKIWLIAYSAYYNTSTESSRDIQKGYEGLLKLSNQLEQIFSMSNLADNLHEMILEAR